MFRPVVIAATSVLALALASNFSAAGQLKAKGAKSKSGIVRGEVFVKLPGGSSQNVVRTKPLWGLRTRSTY